MLYKIEILKFFNDFVLVVFILIKCDIVYLNEFVMFVLRFGWDLYKLDVFELLWNCLNLLREWVNVLDL